MRCRCAAAAVVAMAVMTACSGGDDAAPTTTTPATAAPTTAAATATTAAPTTPAPTTTAPAPTTAPPTTPPTAPAPVTTAPLDPITDLAAAIERDLNLGEQALFVIGADPAAANVQQLAEQYFTGESLANVLAGIQTLLQDELILIPNPEVPNVIRLTSEPVLDQSSGMATASAQTCRIDAGQVWAKLNDTEARFPVNEGIVKILAESRFVLVDGVWRLDGGETISREDDVSTCG